MKDMKWLKTKYFAHRGLHNDEFPENSLGAFQNAIDNGYDIELDVRLTKDNQLVIIHDNSLKRLCGYDGKVSTSSYDIIKDLKLHNTEYGIPLLTEVLDILPKNAHVMIELKTCNRNRTLVSEFLAVMKNYDYVYSVQSFDPRIVRIIRKKAPNLLRGYIKKNKQVNCVILSWIIKLIPVHTWIMPDYYVYKFEDLPNRKMDSFKLKGYPILSYTAKSPEDLAFVKDRYDNAVFEGFIPKQKPIE